MGKIKILSSQEAQKIAAGEVVERPTSILKELLENAIDAGATNITVYLEDGGREQIRIIDNGCGMSPKDAPLSVVRHATSKITSLNDLESIGTYGFRGEALSAITAVSLVRLRTKRAEDVAATELVIENGALIEQKETAGTTGTDIEITNLFYALPARLKFLKSRSVELRALQDLFCSFSCAAPQIQFKLYHQKKLMYNCPSVPDLMKRLQQLYPARMTESLLSINSDDQRMNLKLHGAISNHEFWYHSRKLIHTFVNNRWVKNARLTRSLLLGYQNIMRDRRFPVGWLLLDIDPGSVDINVHPRKEEVAFVLEDIVEQFIRRSVAQRLGKAQSTYLLGSPADFLGNPENRSPGIAHQAHPDIFPPSESQTQSAQSNHTAHPNMQNNPDGSVSTTSQTGHSASFLSSAQQLQSGPISYSSGPRNQQTENHSQKQFATPSIFQAHHENQTPELSSTKVSSCIKTSQELAVDTQTYQLLGQALKTYITIGTSQGITLIDQHAAHERILYEKLRAAPDSSSTIQLIQPCILSLTQTDCDLIEEKQNLLESVGIHTRRIHTHRIAITHCPPLLKNKPLAELIKKFLIAASEQPETTDNPEKTIHEQILILMSCAGAIRAGQTLSAETMHALIHQLNATKNNLTCPHGRPTIWPLSKKTIEKKFKRDYA